jgi:hypothetical protein
MTSLLAMIALLLTALWISVRAESRLASPAARSRRGRFRRCPHSAGQRRFAAAHRGSAAARRPAVARGRCTHATPRSTRGSAAARRPVSRPGLTRACQPKPGSRSHPPRGAGGQREAQLERV